MIFLLIYNFENEEQSPSLLPEIVRGFIVTFLSDNLVPGIYIF